MFRKYGALVGVPTLLFPLLDFTFNNQNFTRFLYDLSLIYGSTLRSLKAGVKILYYYKFLFTPYNADEIHRMSAETILDTCTRNGGLYIKLGQGIASMNHVLPPPYVKALEKLQGFFLASC